MASPQLAATYTMMSDNSNATDEALRSRLKSLSLWDFALDFYCRPGVEPACLLLQDEANIDVCELLWHCWLYHHSLQLVREPPGLADVHHWQQRTTVPLRRLRRELKPAARHSAGIAEVRRYIQQAELAAERETLDRLQRLVEQSGFLTPLSSATAHLKNTLARRWKLQKKTHLSALQTLECLLDPPQPPR